MRWATAPLHSIVLLALAAGSGGDDGPTARISEAPRIVFTQETLNGAQLRVRVVASVTCPGVGCEKGTVLRVLTAWDDDPLEVMLDERLTHRGTTGFEMHIGVDWDGALRIVPELVLPSGARARGEQHVIDVRRQREHDGWVAAHAAAGERLDFLDPSSEDVAALADFARAQCAPAPHPPRLMPPWSVFEAGEARRRRACTARVPRAADAPDRCRRYQDTAPLEAPAPPRLPAPGCSAAARSAPPPRREAPKPAT
jgi:hypothetical protein